MEKRIVVKAGFHRRNFCPVSCNLEGNWEKVKLVDLKKGNEIPCQYENGKLYWVIDELAPEGKKEYLLSEGENQNFSRVELEKKEEYIDVQIDKKLFTSYHFSKKVIRPFLNPVIGPTGKSIVRELFEESESKNPDYDHIHHRGILVAHGDVNGVDNWSEDKECGFIRHVAFSEVSSGPVVGTLTAENTWVSKEEKNLLSETRKMRFYNLSEIRLIDFEITFRTTEGDVTFGDTKEGGIMAVRVATPMRGDRSGMFENAYGAVAEKEGWGKRAPWCDYYGPLDSKTVGISIFDHPENFRYPTYWHIRDYGLMTANPFALSSYYQDKNRNGSHTVPANKEFKFSYRIYIHKGDTRKGNVSEMFNNYINPPEYEIRDM